MSGPRQIDELLMLRAVEGLEPAQHRDVEAILAARPEIDPDAFDMAAAAIDQAMTRVERPLPAQLRRRILAAAREADLVVPETATTVTEAAIPPAADVVSLDDRRSPAATATWIPWLAAAAAALVAIAGWWPQQTTPAAQETVAEAPVEVPSPAESSPLAAIENAPDALVRPWSTTEDPTATGATGQVVWSTDRQDGFMRISGLAPNDPSVEQYQLWIFDKTQDERYPIDGGVFDMPPGDTEAIVPIDAKIAVDEPYLFAVTVEKPGGVVVSSRERITLLAEV